MAAHNKKNTHASRSSVSEMSRWKKGAIVAGMAVGLALPGLVEGIAKKDQSVNPDRKGGVVIKMNASELEELAGKSAPVDEFEFFKKAKAEDKELGIKGKIDQILYKDILSWDIESDKYRSINPETEEYDETEKDGRMSKNYPDGCVGQSTCAYTQIAIVKTSDNKKIKVILAIGDIPSATSETGIAHGVFLAFRITDAKDQIINIKVYNIEKLAEIYKKTRGKEMHFGNIIIEHGEDNGEYFTFYVAGVDKPGERIKPNTFMFAFGYDTRGIYEGNVQLCKRD